MTPVVGDDVILLAAAVYDLASAVFYLSTAVVTLAVVGLIGYWVALRRARE